jgi:predicted nucleotidyltransferase
MARTALEMSADELKQYKPFSRKRQGDEFLLQPAWEVARQAASLLYEKFNAKRVLVFGSLLHRERFTRRSDIDIAVWGIPPEKFFKAVAKMIDLSQQFQIDLVGAEYCSERMKQRIEKEGVAV